MMKNIGLLFDFNGVLVTDEPQQQAAMDAALKPYGVMLTEELYQQHCLGRTDTVGFGNLQNQFPDQLQSVSIRDLVKAKLDHYEALAGKSFFLAYGLRETLAALTPAAKLGIVSGAPRREIELLLGQAGLLPMFSSIVTDEDTAHSKPHPEGYEKGTAALALPPSHVLAIEDTPHGIAAAQAAGLYCIAVSSTLPERELGQADTVVGRLADITPALVMSLIPILSGNST